MVAELLSRPDKLNNAQTILYEIEMLRHAKSRLDAGGPSWTKADQCVHLEVFLLHFRNLVEFFGRNPKFSDDLSISTPSDVWPEQKPEQAALDQMSRPDLFRKYEIDARPLSISKYLQHCTTQRTTPMSWDINKMYEDLNPTIDLFESLVPKEDREYVLESCRGGNFTVHGESSIQTSSFSNTLRKD
jgi:hypothetical protein